MTEPNRSATALPDSWLTDVAILLADAVRRHAGGALGVCGLLFLLVLLLPVETACVLACGLIPVALAAERSLRPRRRIVLPALALVVLLATFAPDHSAARLLAQRDLDGQFDLTNTFSGPVLLEGAGARLVAIIVAGIAGGVLAGRRPTSRRRYHLAGVLTLGVLLVTAGFSFSPGGFEIELESWAWTPAAILACLGYTYLAASPLRSRWLVAASVLAMTAALLSSQREALVASALCVGPLTARVVRVLQPEGLWRRDAAAARLARRICERPFRSSFVTYGFFFLAWHSMATPLWFTQWWIAGPEQGPGSPRSMGMFAITPWMGTCASIILVCGSHGARGLLERVLVLSAQLTAPLVWAAVLWFYVARLGGAFDLADLTEGFWPLFLCIAAAFALARGMRRAGRRAFVAVAAIAAVSAPIALGGWLPEFDPGATSERATMLATTVAGLPSLVLIGALTARRHPAGGALLGWVTSGVVTVAALLCLLDQSPEPARVVVQTLINGLVVVLIIWISRQLLLVTPLASDHAVFVLGKERAAKAVEAEWAA